MPLNRKELVQQVQQLNAAELNQYIHYLLGLYRTKVMAEVKAEIEHEWDLMQQELERVIIDSLHF